MMITWLTLIGIIIIISLASYAGWLLYRLYRQNKWIKDGEKKRLAYIYESIATIGLAMQQGQCELSEGCIRVVVLMDNLPDASQNQFSQRFPNIHALYEKVKRFPTHEARKKLSKKEIFEQDKQRFQYERELEAVIQEDLVSLLSWVRKEKG